MKLILLGIISVSLITSCGRAPGTYVGFESYVDSFVAEGAARGVKVDTFGLDIKVVDNFGGAAKDGAIGRCITGTGRIQILRDFWEHEERDREEVMFHELGHCALDKGHAPCPSLMCGEGIMGDYEYKRNRSYYLDGLFKN